MRLTARRAATLALLLIVSLISPSVAAQKKRRRAARRVQHATAQPTPQPTPVATPAPEKRPTVTAAKIREDVVNWQVTGIPVVGMRNRRDTWTFAPDEWKEVDDVRFDQDGDNATALAHIQTSDVKDSAEMEGAMRLYYEWYKGGWTLNKIENVSLVLRVRRTATQSTPFPKTPESPSGRRTTIVNNTFTVAPGRYQYFGFYVPSYMAQVFGRFRAQGGGGNDIICFIVDQDGFENFAAGHTVNTYYNSGQVTVGTINVRLSQGQYYIVFSNTYSTFSNKAVAATLEMQEQ